MLVSLRGVRACQNRPDKHDKNFLMRTLNQALYFHCIKLDFAKARAVYESLPKKHPAVLWSWGVFVLADDHGQREVQWEIAQAAFVEARKRDDVAAEFYHIRQYVVSSGCVWFARCYDRR